MSDPGAEEFVEYTAKRWEKSCDLSPGFIKNFLGGVAWAFMVHLAREAQDLKNWLPDRLHQDTFYEPNKFKPLPKGNLLKNAGIECDMFWGPCSCGAWHQGFEV